MTKYQCAHCQATFRNMTEHMSHVIQQHDVGFVPADSGRRLLRASHCWSCAQPIAQDKDACVCGAVHPRHRFNNPKKGEQ